MIVPNSPSAEPAVVAAERLPSINRKYSVRERRIAASKCAGAQKSARVSGKENSGGMTPTIVCGCPASVID
jgi:hypothetical protein